MNIIVTKHAKQRRPESIVFKSEIIESWVKYFIEKFNLFWMSKNGKYVIESRDQLIVLNKDKENIIVVTFYGFENTEEIWKNKDNINFKIKHEICNDLHIYDKNKNVRRCGKILKTLNGLELQLKHKYYKIYNCNFHRKRFKDINEIIQMNIIYKDKFNRLFLV